jgi:S-DNA-T family DNA segregation ATPase FtsK/SpoIIIE
MATARQTRPAPRKPAPARSASAGRAASAARRKPANPRLVYDMCGVALVALSLILFATLLWPPARAGENLFGATVVAGLRLVIGAGAWAFPLVLLVSGVMLCVGKSRSWDNIGGAVGLFLLFVTWWHLGHVPIAGQFATDNLLNYGGYVGAALSWCIRSAVGTMGGHVMLGAITVVAFLYLTDIPLPSLLGPFERLVSSGAQAGGSAVANGGRRIREKAEDLRESRRHRIPVEPSRPAPEERPTRPASRLFQRESSTVTRETPAAEPPPLTPADRRLGGLFARHTPEPAPEPEEPPTTESHQPASADAAPSAPRAKKAPATPAALAKGVDPSAPALEDAKKFTLPPFALLKTAPPVPARPPGAGEERRDVLLQTLEDFGIGADVAEISHGPTITRYEVTLERGIKVSKIVSLADNLAMALAAIDVRVEAPIPGKSAIGIEVPNETPALVALRDVIERAEFQNAPGRLTFALGKDVTGTCRYADLAKMPHLLIAGSTGSGKSAGLNSLICSLLYRCTPRELKLLMIDPKKVELSLYDGIPHLAAPVITDVKMAPSIFKQAIREMEHRYDKFAKVGTRNIEGYNGKVEEDEKLPYWVLIVDELADLMMTAGADIEQSICRLAQLARATGIHLVIATQRPSVNVITGTIKANISSRIAFAMNSAVDSRTILDSVGADRLIGRGDMLYLPMDAAKPTRLQGCFVSEQETEALVNYLKQQAQPSYDVLPSTLATATGEDDSGETEADDDLFEQAVRLVVTGGSASTSMLQRRFKIGYTRAARLVDLMEQRGIVGALDGAKPREILVSRDQVDAMFAPDNGAE